MTVENLIEELKQMPPTALVWVQKSDQPEDTRAVWEDHEIVSIAYRQAVCVIRIEEA